MRGKFRIYLGAAPGVGKTYAMLGEARRRRERGTDVVVGYVECHKRPRTQDLLEDLEIVPSKTMTYRDATFTEMDTAAVIARAPQVALVDELAHTNVPGSEHEKRWQDIEDLLDAGINVISTVNVQHLESVNDVVEQITGIPQRNGARRSGAPGGSWSSWWTWRRRLFSGEWRTAISIRRKKWMPHWATTSGSGTSPRCASWQCCGWRTRWTTSSTATAPATTSQGRGKRGSVWSWD
jgi:hypothetical protein